MLLSSGRNRRTLSGTLKRALEHTTVCLTPLVPTGLTMNSPSHLPASESLAYVEGIYQEYLRDRNAVPEEWREYFSNNGDGTASEGVGFGPTFRPASLFNPPAGSSNGHGYDAARVALLQDRVNLLIRNYRIRGHMLANIDPLDLPRAKPRELEMGFFGFTEEDMEQRVSCENLQSPGEKSIKEIVSLLKNTYCRSIGVQYMHIDDIHVRRWLQKRMEDTENHLELTRKEQKRILTKLVDAVTFEEFLHKKFIGAKSFSLDGCESLIPLLDLAIESAGEQGNLEIVLGMAHRGRLNVLANIMAKNPRDIFREFADKDPELYTGRGDVKYHLGHSHDWTTESGKKVHLSLCFNPSHLEFVNTVAIGRVRAKQDRVGDIHQNKCMAILIHGDAAFAGEGVVQEMLNMSQLPGYAIGGTLHVIVNNQIGFTTSPVESRSSTYAADVARMLQSPIFHVNGENPEAVAQCVRLAMEFRKTFRRDVVIDMYGYRRLGHNETDEPSFTQPVLYRAISQRKTVLEGYLDHLLKLQGVTREEADNIIEQRREFLEQHLSESKSENYKRPPARIRGVWSRCGFQGGEDGPDPQTGVNADRLSLLLATQCNYPDDFTPHPKIVKWLETRLEMAEGKKPLDWSSGEALAFASLLADGASVRLSGQDARRGTFSHRHAVLYDYNDGLTHIPLQNLSDEQGTFQVYNSPLNETGVLGFDYGYSLDCPDSLVIWEAQFGDFANVAQVIFDQFITSGEDKWNRLSGLVMLLPHGFEGMGPEHSSARLERYLTLAAEDNIRVIYPTTPAQIFHLLRRQVLSEWRKPAVVMSPKSLLRHPQVTSTFDDLAKGTFQRFIPDQSHTPKTKITRIILCSGKVYYDLDKEREERGIKDVAIIRLEQLYPLKDETLKAMLSGYKKGTPVTWVQEEPENMGAWRYFRNRVSDNILGAYPLSRVSRPESASPATGSANSHRREQAQLLDEALGNK